MKLTTHFSLEELTVSSYAIRHGIDNVPVDPKILANLLILAQGLEVVRTIVSKPIIVTSGYRSKRVNTGVGGSKKSSHMIGLAADIKVHGITPLELAKQIAYHRRAVKYDQVINEFNQWVHIAFSDVTSIPRGQLLTARKGVKGTEYVEGLV